MNLIISRNNFKNMQKFVVKKISRSTNILLTSEHDQSLSCGAVDNTQKTVATDTEGQPIEASSVKMCGYLKKKRNRVGGWSKLYFVLQNGLLMSYNSKEEYEKKLVSFKDVICLIPNNTVLLPSLEPRFTIATNLHTFYTFRCDDNRTASKWITAILECLSRDFSGTSSSVCNSSDNKKIVSKPKVFLSQPNLSSKLKSSYNNHSWEHIPKSNWIVTHNGRILMELNHKNTSNRAKLPIGETTAKLLQKCSVNDVIASSPNMSTCSGKQQHKVRFNSQHQIHDENQNLIRNDDRNERAALKSSEEPFRDYATCKNTNRSGKSQKHSNDLDNRLSNKLFGEKIENENWKNSEPSYNYNSPEGLYSEVGRETQEQIMSFDHETGDYASIGFDRSIDSKKINNKLNIEVQGTRNPIHTDQEIPEYATVDLEKKHEIKRDVKNTLDDQFIDDDDGTYEDIATYSKIQSPKKEDPVIYELIDIPLQQTQKSRSLVWKNWSNRIHLIDFAKRFKGSAENLSPPSTTDTLNKRQRISLTFSDFSKRFSYRSMRDKAKSFCNRSNTAGNEGGSLASSTVTETESESSFDKNNSTKL